jgi:dTDP-4-amino-4,6-dideoxygalactose transaminase
MSDPAVLPSPSRRLAILGGEPLFPQPLHVGRPNIGSRAQFMDHVNRIFDSLWLTNHGPLAQQFEQELAGFLKVRHCIPVCNATVGLQIAVRALGLTGEVILPSFTFIATAHVLQWLGLTPVFADIDPHTHNLDPHSVEIKITPNTRGILGVHVWGRPCETDALQKIAEAHDLRLFYDAAHAFACASNSRMIGSFGDAEVFSFHATKFFNSFEGGAIATNNDDLAARIRLMLNFGFSGYDTVISVGINGKMSEISAAMGLTNLRMLDEFVQNNIRNYRKYQHELASIPGFSLAQFDENEKNNYQYVAVEIDPKIAGIRRDDLLATLHAENVLARRYFWPGCHRMEPYHSLFPNISLPETERLADRILVLPTGSTINEQHIDAICSILRTACSCADKIRQQNREKIIRDRNL